MKRWLAIIIAAGALLLTPSPAVAADGQRASVSLVSVSGTGGHAFVYAQVTDAISRMPAPNGLFYDSPYYSLWYPHPTGIASCPYIWVIYVYDRASDTQLNETTRIGGPVHLDTGSIMCQTAGRSPVGAPILAAARARLDLDLQVTLSPAAARAGEPASLTATLSSALSEDLSLYLSMAIEDWTVDWWDVDFGDGQTQSMSDAHGSSLRLPHVYQAAGAYDAYVIAHISGHAQAAAYDSFGNPYLISRGFTVDVANGTSARLNRRPVVAYVSPQVAAAVSPVLPGSDVRPGPAFQHVEALRGTLTDFYVRPTIIREGYLTYDGIRAGGARSGLSSWRYTGPPTDAPPGTSTVPNAVYRETDPLRLQWNAPDVVIGQHAQDYTVPLVLAVRTVYSDGHVVTFQISSNFTVTVGFAAENG